MSKLRLRLAALLIGAILSVVVLATALSFLLVDRPNFSTASDAVAAEVAASLRLMPDADGRPTRPLDVLQAPPAGAVMEAATQHLREALQRRGMIGHAVITVPNGSKWPVVAYEAAAGRWLSLPVAFPAPPHNGVYLLGGWILLIAFGTSAVALITVHRLIQPLALVERAVAGIGPNGELPIMPETGPDEVRTMARAINLLATRLRTATESRMRLVAAAGHDLRTPLTRMRLRAEFLDGDDQQKWLNDLEELDRIADSAIMLVREEVESPPSEGIRIDWLIEGVVEELRDLNLPVELAQTEPATVLGRPLALKRALRNLMTNAATHGQGATVSVGIEAGHVAIGITDQGPGIPENLMRQVFEPFFRVDPARRAVIPGAGLGLAIAKEILDRNGAALTLINRDDGGLTQTIVFAARNLEEHVLREGTVQQSLPFLPGKPPPEVRRTA